MTTVSIPHKRITQVFADFCAIISPCTPDEEVLELQGTAARGKLDWEAVAWCANRAALAPALHAALIDKGLGDEAPEMLRAYLDEIHRFNASRNDSLLSMLGEVTHLLNREGITPLLLKGGAALATDLFPDPGMCFMWDLDMLVPPEKFESSISALNAVGYAVPDKYRDGSGSVPDFSLRHHYPPLARPDAPTALELHRRVLSSGDDLLDTAAIWENSRRYAGRRLPGAAADLMSPTDEFIHCIAHSEISHHHHRHYRADARHMHHFAHLFLRYREEIDWDRIESLQRHPRFGQIFRTYLHMAKTLFRVDLPIATEPDRATERHYRIAVSDGPGRLHVAHMLFREIMWVFSEDRLRKIYRPADASIARLRLRHLRALLGSYYRPEAWKRKLKVLQR